MEPDFKSYQSEPQSLKSHLIEFFQTLVVFAAIGSIIYWQIAQPHRVSGSSMFPNFHDNDYIITDKLSYKLSLPKRGDIIVFKNPRNEREDYIKRIIGLPQDKILIADNSVYLNGSKLSEPYLKGDTITNTSSFMVQDKQIQIPSGEYFVLGDNRGYSSDSREWGLVRKDEIVGKVLLRYWPIDSLGVYPAAYNKY